MFYKGKEHTFVIYNGKVTPPEWLFRKMGQKLSTALGVTLAAPAVVLTETDTPAAARHVRLVLSDGTEHQLANATINGSTVELAAL
jgi:hypothetical protein